MIPDAPATPAPEEAADPDPQPTPRNGRKTIFAAELYEDDDEDVAGQGQPPLVHDRGGNDG